MDFDNIDFTAILINEELLDEVNRRIKDKKFELLSLEKYKQVLEDEMNG